MNDRKADDYTKRRHVGQYCTFSLGNSTEKNTERKAEKKRVGWINVFLKKNKEYRKTIENKKHLKDKVKIVQLFVEKHGKKLIFFGKNYRQNKNSLL